MAMAVSGPVRSISGWWTLWLVSMFGDDMAPRRNSMMASRPSNE
jgi:hypothetical protein